MKSIETLNQKLNPLRHFKPKQKQLFRLGCAALALALAQHHGRAEARQKHDRRHQLAAAGFRR